MSTTCEKSPSDDRGTGPEFRSAEVHSGMDLGRPKMPKRQVTPGMNRRLASQVWGKPSRIAIRTLDRLTAAYGVSVAEGDLSLIDGKWYVTHAGLLRLAARRRCAAICVRPVRQFCDPSAGRWVFKANVYKVS